MAVHVSASLPPKIRFRWALWAGMIVLCLILAAAAIVIMVALTIPLRSSPQQSVFSAERYAKRTGTTLSHVIPGLLLLLLIPFQVSRSFRRRHLVWHRWMGRVALLISAVIALSGFALALHPIDGAAEVSAVLVFDSLFVMALIAAYVHVRRGEIALHREWMIRAMSIALGVSTVRVVFAAFVFDPWSHLAAVRAFGISFWIGWALNLLAAEMWIRYTRKRYPVAVIA